MHTIYVYCRVRVLCTWIWAWNLTIFGFSGIWSVNTTVPNTGILGRHRNRVHQSNSCLLPGHRRKRYHAPSLQVNLRGLYQKSWAWQLLIIYIEIRVSSYIFSSERVCQNSIKFQRVSRVKCHVTRVSTCQRRSVTRHTSTFWAVWGPTFPDIHWEA